MAYWGTKKVNIPNKQPPLKIGEGENTLLTPFEIKSSESTYSRNTSSRKYPALSVCPGRSNAFAAITTPNAFGVRANQYSHFLDGTVWKRWNGSALQNVATGLTSARGRFVDFITEAKTYTVLVNGTDKKAWDGTDVIDLTDAPATRLYTAANYRLFALSGNTIKCSAEGSLTDWTTSLDANSITVTPAKGPGTAIAFYNDVIIAFFEQSMHTLYGHDPYDQEFGPMFDDGCISDYTVIENGGKLYFLDYGAFKVFTGGKPQEVSQKVRSYLEGINLAYKNKCVAGSVGKYIYLAIPYGSTENNLILEYDTELGNWYPQTGNVVDFVNIGESLYGITSTGQPILMNSGTTFQGTAIEWERIGGVITDGVFEKKVVSNINTIVDLPAGSTLNIYASTSINTDTFDLLYTFTAAADVQNLSIKIPTTKLQNIDWYRLKLSGTGPCTVHYIGQEERIKPR